MQKTIIENVYNGYAHPLPAGCTIGGDAYLRGYAHPLPAGCTIGGNAYLADYAHPLPAGCTIGGNAYLRGYAHPLPAGCTIGGSADLRGYAHPLPDDLKMFGVHGAVIGNDGEYVLWAGTDGLFYAGCRRRFTREKALHHWHRRDERALLFTAAIKNMEIAK